MPRLTVRDFGTALRFVESSVDKVIFTNTIALTGELTISWWSRIQYIPTANRTFFGHGADTSKIATASGKFFVRALNAGISDTTVSLPTDSEWHHFAVTRDANNKLDFYRDGVLVTRLFGDVAQVGTWNVDRIASSSGAPAFGGSFDQSLIFSRCLTAAEISSFYFAGTFSRTNLQLEYLLNEGSGTTATDSSGNGNTGTITGATYTSDVPMKLRTAATNRLTVRDFPAALSFDGVDDRVEIPSVNLALGNVFTIEAWIKPDVTTSTASQTIWGADNTTGQFHLRTNGKQITAFIPGTLIATSSDSLVLGQWNHVVYARNGTGATHAIQINGITQTLTTNSTTAYSDGASIKLIGSKTGVTELFKGKISNIRIWTRFFSEAERQDLYYSGRPDDTTNLKSKYKLNEGAGTTANDTSGNANHGTITGATFTADTPMKARSLVGGNLVKNGNYKYAPPFVAAQTADGWLDGTAAGGGTGNAPTPINIYVNVGGVGASARIQTDVTRDGSNALEIDIQAGGFGEVYHGANTYYGRVGYDDSIPVLPSTSYTLTGWMKTEYISGDSNDGAFIAVSQGNGDKTGVTSAGITKIKTTTDWTFYTVTFTTHANTRFAVVQSRIYGHTGAANLRMKAWFDDITLNLTTPTTRSAVV